MGSHLKVFISEKSAKKNSKNMNFKISSVLSILVIFGTISLAQEEEVKVKCFQCIYDTRSNPDNENCLEPKVENAIDTTNGTTGVNCLAFDNLCIVECGRKDRICLKAETEFEQKNSDGIAETVYSVSRTCITKGVLTNDDTILDKCNAAEIWSRKKSQCVCNTDLCNSSENFKMNLLNFLVCSVLPFLLSNKF